MKIFRNQKQVRIASAVKLVVKIQQKKFRQKNAKKKIQTMDRQTQEFVNLLPIGVQCKMGNEIYRHFENESNIFERSTNLEKSFFAFGQQL